MIRGRIVRREHKRSGIFPVTGAAHRMQHDWPRLFAYQEEDRKAPRSHGSEATGVPLRSSILSRARRTEGAGGEGWKTICGGGGMDVLGVRGTSLPEFDRSSGSWGDWPLCFELGMMACSLEVCRALMYAEANVVSLGRSGPRAGGLVPLGQAFRRSWAKAQGRPACDPSGNRRLQTVYAWSRKARQSNLNTLARCVKNARA